MPPSVEFRPSSAPRDDAPFDERVAPFSPWWREFSRWRRYPADALVGMVFAILAGVAFGPVPALVPALALAVVTPVLWRVDVVARRLPNGLVYPCGALTAGAVIASGVVDADAATAALATVGCAALVFVVLSIGGGMGMGDVKLAVVLAGVLALVRPDAVVLAAVIAFLSGGVVGLIVLLRVRARSIPFGPFLLVGFWVAVVSVA
ncbi:prepilin peptidase [Labedella phragmitis]|uniref:Prepilin peptidase n=1 Tax=Labedella phragmitis TaxID=2498849 RepID=A0A3S3Z1F9_9MICO|nr:A24 family peptidase [Labedella phragmitis]RWZ49640.1 prepilin peptidase [Labedella phragmitis]